MRNERALRHTIRLIESSPLLDPQWYLARYPDVASLGMSPAEHYVRLGARMLRDPGPDFCTEFYLATNPDGAQAPINPLAHYIAHGRAEGRRGVSQPRVAAVDPPDSAD
jgi:hypothetical protein